MCFDINKKLSIFNKKHWCDVCCVRIKKNILNFTLEWSAIQIEILIVIAEHAFQCCKIVNICLNKNFVTTFHRNLSASMSNLILQTMHRFSFKKKKRKQFRVTWILLVFYVSLFGLWLSSPPQCFSFFNKLYRICHHTVASSIKNHCVFALMNVC